MTFIPQGGFPRDTFQIFYNQIELRLISVHANVLVDFDKNNRHGGERCQHLLLETFILSPLADVTICCRVKQEAEPERNHASVKYRNSAVQTFMNLTQFLLDSLFPPSSPIRSDHCLPKCCTSSFSDEHGRTDVSSGYQTLPITLNMYTL